LNVGVVVKERRARMAEAEVVVICVGAGAGAAAERSVRVVEGRRRKEARSLVAIVAGFLWFVGVVVAVEVGLAAAAIEMRGGVCS